MTTDWMYALIIGTALGAVAMTAITVLMPASVTGDSFTARLKGRRTYIIAAIGIALTIGEKTELLPLGIFDKVDMVFNMAGLITMRMAIANLKKADSQPQESRPVIDLREDFTK